MTAADTTTLLEKLDKPVRDLKWEPAIHGGWVALGAAGNYHIYKDRRNGEVVYEVSNPFNYDNPRFPTSDEAKAAAQADYERRILAALSLTPSDLEAIKAALVEREWQTIDTAPRDGTEILAWFPRLKLDEDGDLTDELVDDEPFGGRAIIAWEGGCWSEPDWLSASGDWFGDDFEYAPDPTMWQPLPAPPRAALGKDES